MTLLRQQMITAMQVRGFSPPILQQVSQPALARHLHSIAPTALTHIERRICAGYAVTQLRTRHVLADTDREGHRGIEAVLTPVVLRHGTADSFSNVQCLLAVSIRQHRKKFLATPAADIVLAQRHYQREGTQPATKNEKEVSTRVSTFSALTAASYLSLHRGRSFHARQEQGDTEPLRPLHSYSQVKSID